MNDKKYYWLKLKRDFFKRHDIRIVEEMPNGKDYILFYLKLLLESIDHDGALRFSDAIPYNENMLSIITNTNVDIVRAAMAVFKDLNMIEILDDNTIYMNEVSKYIGSETAAAERQRRSRANRKPAICDNVTPTSQNCHIELDIDKDIELDIDKDIELKKEVKKKNRFVPPTIEEVKSYCAERKNDVDAERFYNYYSSNGWKVGKNNMKDWRAAVRYWEQRGGSGAKAETTTGGNVFLNMLTDE